MEMNMQDFDVVDAEASSTVPRQCSTLRKGGLVILKGKACKIVEMVISQPGKHGHSKIRITGLEMFTNKKVEDIIPSAQNVDVPVAKKKEYQLINISSDKFVTLMDNETCQIRSDMRLPDGEIGEQMKNVHDKEPGRLLCTVIEVMKVERIQSIKKIMD